MIYSNEKLQFVVSIYNEDKNFVVGNLSYRLNTFEDYKFISYIKMSKPKNLSNIDVSYFELDNESNINEQYYKKYNFHKGLLKVNNYEMYLLQSESEKDNYIVLGNNVNNEDSEKFFIGNTRKPYIEVYNMIIPHILDSKIVTIIFKK